jgi:hypothetical protein
VGERLKNVTSLRREEGRADSLDDYEFTDEYIVQNERKMVQRSPPVPTRQSSMAARIFARYTTYTDNATELDLVTLNTALKRVTPEEKEL